MAHPTSTDTFVTASTFAEITGRRKVGAPEAPGSGQHDLHVTSGDPLEPAGPGTAVEPASHVQVHRSADATKQHMMHNFPHHGKSLMLTNVCVLPVASRHADALQLTLPQNASHCMLTNLPELNTHSMQSF
jgi:hypothetical protein